MTLYYFTCVTARMFLRSYRSEAVVTLTAQISHDICAVAVRRHNVRNKNVSMDIELPVDLVVAKGHGHMNEQK